jgi:hypothetical protein
MGKEVISVSSFPSLFISKVYENIVASLCLLLGTSAHFYIIKYTGPVSFDTGFGVG